MQSTIYKKVAKEITLLAKNSKWGELRSYFFYWDSEEELVAKVLAWGRFFLPTFFRDTSPEFHKDLIRENFSDKNEYTAAPRGYAKALALDTPILTINGFKELKDVKVGDYIFTEKGKQTKVIKKSEVFNNRECYKVIFSDGSEIIADAEHDWMVETRLERSRVCDFRKRNKTIPVRLLKKTTKELSQDIYVKSGNRLEVNYSIPVTEPIELEEKNLLVEPYFLGQWLGDGTSDGSGITTADEETIEYIYKYAKNLGFEVRITKAGGCSKTYNITSKRQGIRKKTIHSLLRQIGVLNNKHIPEKYLLGSKQQRLELLQGLMDSDGTISKSGHCSFTSTKKRLANDVRKLLWTLGIKNTMIESEAKIYGVTKSKSYLVAFTTDLKVFRLKRKLDRMVQTNIRTKRRFIVDIKKVNSVPVQCLGVDSPTHLFLAGYELIPTHNTTINQLCIAYICAHKLRKFVVMIEKSYTEAAEVLKTVTNQFKDNLMIRQVYGDLVKADEKGEFDDKNKDSFGDVVINGVRLRAKGFNTPIRGLKSNEWRPDLILLDDVESDEHIQNEEQRRKYRENYGQGIVPAIDIKGTIKVRGTILHNDSLLKTLIDQFNGKIYKAFQREDPENTLLWKERWTYELLMKKKTEMELEGKGTGKFYQEYLNEPIDDENRPFHLNWLQKEFIEEDLKFRAVSRTATIDVAETIKQGSDFTAVSIVDWDSENNWFIQNSKRHKINITGLVDLIFSIWQYYKPAKIGVEKKAFEDQIKPLLKIRSEETGVYPIVVELEHGGRSKEDRIKGALQGRFEAGKIWFKKNSVDDSKILKGELLDFPVGKHDDLIDALAYTEQIGYRPMGKAKGQMTQLEQEFWENKNKLNNNVVSRLRNL